jgi:PrtD family type I secretion system ABC transporter
MVTSKATASVTRSIVDIGLFSTLINALLLVSPLYMLQVYDRVLPASSIPTLIYLSLIAVVALGFLGLFEVVRAIYSQRVAASIDKHLAASVFRTSTLGPRAESGDIQPLRDLATVRSFAASKGLATLFDLPFVLPFMLLLAFIHPALGLLTLAGAAIMILLVVLTQLTTGRSSAKATEQMAKAQLSAQAFARNAETVRAMGMGQNLTETWGQGFAHALDLQDRSAGGSAVSAAISRVLRMLLQLSVLGLGAWLVLQEEMTAGMIFAASLISGRAVQPLDQLIAGWRQTIDAKRAWQRLKVATSLPQDAPKIRLPAPAGRMRAKDLVYMPPGAPSGREPIIRRVSFEIQPGEAVAIIGPSQAGKSTLAKLLVGAIQPSAGSVELDGANLRTWDEEQLGGHTGYLSQEVQLLPGTIAQNVARFDPATSDAAVVEAAQRAQAHELILSQPDGYQTRVEMAGLSGGERQRIGLARAFYGDPKILVLDEPNSNLDQEGEAALARALAVARQSGTTVIVITHRLSLAADCDRVMVLRAGIIEAFGPSGNVLKQVTGARGKPAEAAPEDLRRRQPPPRTPSLAAVGGAAAASPNRSAER